MGLFSYFTFENYPTWEFIENIRIHALCVCVYVCAYVYACVFLCLIHVCYSFRAQVNMYFLCVYEWRFFVFFSVRIWFGVCMYVCVCLKCLKLCRKWNRRPEFKSWTRLFVFHTALISLEKVWIQLFFLRLWIYNRNNWYGSQSRRKTLNSNLLYSAQKLNLYLHPVRCGGVG